MKDTVGVYRRESVVCAYTLLNLNGCFFTWRTTATQVSEVMGKHRAFDFIISRIYLSRCPPRWYSCFSDIIWVERFFVGRYVDGNLNYNNICCSAVSDERTAVRLRPQRSHQGTQHVLRPRASHQSGMGDWSLIFSGEVISHRNGRSWLIMSQQIAGCRDVWNDAGDVVVFKTLKRYTIF